MNNDPTVRLRRKPEVRVVGQASGVTVYREPHIVPVLPPGWASLEPQDEAAVLLACDEMTDACRLRVGSAWDAASEYRVYRLEGDTWGGVCTATVFTAGRNARLLAVAHTPERAAQVALDFVNWDLEATGTTWRLSLAID